MTHEQYMKNLTPPQGPVDAVLDTDTYNEIDDQYALSYMLAYGDRIRIRGLYAAPFSNDLAADPGTGMEKSYGEILHLLSLTGRQDLVPLVRRGSRGYLADESTPEESEACAHLLKLSADYSPEHPLYIVAIGCIVNIASALIKDPTLAERCVIVWLGGHALDKPDTAEFNMVQDIASARVVFASGAPLVMLPCNGVVSEFRLSDAEVDARLRGHSPLCDYLADHTTEAAMKHSHGKPWSRVIWDVTAVAFLVNSRGRFEKCTVIDRPMPGYDRKYDLSDRRSPMTYVWRIQRDALMADLIEKLYSL